MAISNFLNVPVRMADLITRVGLEPLGTSESPGAGSESPAGTGTSAVGAVSPGLTTTAPELSPTAGRPGSAPEACWRHRPPAPDRVSQPRAGSPGDLPLQAITPGGPLSTHLRSCPSNYTVNGNECWSTVWYFSTRPIRFALRTYVRGDVTLSLVMRTCFPLPSAFAVIVNGQNLQTYNPSDDTWFTQHITLPAGCLVQGTNHIELKTPAAAHTQLGIPLGIWVQSASVGWNPG